MGKRYDLIAIGGGTTGLVAATTAAGLGARVALVERDRLGGDCLWTGCIPSKALLASAERAHAVRTAADYGIEAADPAVDFGAVMERVRSVIAAAGRPDTPEALIAQGVEVVEGEAAFSGPGRIEVAGRPLEFRAALIATGSRPTLPPIEGLAEADPLTTENIFELTALPRRLLVIGGGPIGCELGQAFGRLGAEVTIVEALPRLLPNEEPFAGEMIEHLLRAEGVNVRTGLGGERIEPGTGGCGDLRLADGVVPFDRVLVATGQAPVTDSLGLSAVGVETDGAGAIVVDEQLRTSGDRIFAGGDVIGDYQFTHVAAYHALVATANALFRARRRIEREWTPWATFTDPEVARVGLTESQARARFGDAVEVFEHDYGELDRALTAGTTGAAKLVAGRRGRLLGTTVVGAAAGEAIAEAARVVRERGKVGDVSQMIHVYPSYTEGPARAADDYWRRRFFTPSARRWFRPLLALLRALDHPRD